MNTYLVKRVLAWMPGAVGGLFVARVALELTRRPWAGFIVLGIASLVGLGGLAWGRRRTPHGSHLWSVLLLGVYVVWPRRDPRVALQVAVATALVWLLAVLNGIGDADRASFRPRWLESSADGATFVVALIVYAATCARDVLPADAGEFQWVLPLLGVAHPPGFPLYTMVGHLFTRLLPWGTPAYRVNLMSGVLAAGTLLLTARATRLWARRLGASSLGALTGGLAAALVLGSATTFWAQATIASARSLTVFFTALALYALSRFGAADEAQQVERALVLLGLALGLGLGHHSLGFASTLFVVVYVVLIAPRLLVQPRRWWRPVLAGLAGLLPLVYLPIRGAMNAPQAPPGLETLPGFLHHFLARGFGGDMLAFANAADLPHRVALLPTLFLFQFNGLLLTVALVALLGLLRRDWRLFVLLAGLLFLQTFVAITYRAPQTVEYLMPAYFPVAIAVGLFPALFTPARLQSRFSVLLCALVLWAGLLNGWAHAPGFAELPDDRTARQTVEPLLETAPAGARVLAGWRWFTPLRYLQRIEGLRPDVEVAEVYPVAGEEYRDTWLRRVEETAPGQPLLLTSFYSFDGYVTEPWEAGFLLRPRPVTEPLAPLTPVSATFGEQVTLWGYSLRQERDQSRFQPGQTVEFVLAWQAVGSLDVQPSFTLRLVDADGRRVAQADRALRTDLLPGEVWFERLVLPLYPDLPPGRYRVTLGSYVVAAGEFRTLPADDGEAAVTLTELELTPLSRPPVTLHPLDVPFDGGPTLVGVDYDRSVPQVLRVYLHWRGRAVGARQVRVRAAAGEEGVAALPGIPKGAYQSVVVDLPGYVEGPVWLTLTDAAGERVRAAGAWNWSSPQVRLPAPSRDARFVPLGDEMVVIGATAHPVAPGEAMAVDVKLVAQRSLTTDDSISVRLMNQEGGWLDRDDCQPALGAVPTLKWIRGSRVMDRHLLRIPADFNGAEVQAGLVAYERFRIAPLPAMDGRFDQVPLGRWSLP